MDRSRHRKLANAGRGSEDLSDARLSPDGRHVSFIRDHALWLTSTATGATHRLTPAGYNDLREAETDWPYRNELRSSNAYWWSPDSSQIAYLETDDRATGKYTLRSADGHERTHCLSVTRRCATCCPCICPACGWWPTPRHRSGQHQGWLSARLTWTPDSRHLAVEHLSRSQKTLDLLIVDTVTGQSPSHYQRKTATGSISATARTSCGIRGVSSGRANAVAIVISISMI